ncbi:thymidine kinase [Nakamurella lactea]|uniref:thymidine kinase n=1 Tax=Nakamurella lactea TaxID=459515 RepID=UPI00040C61B1|nr:thymidine kinase [Nakamurella lactea]
MPSERQPPVDRDVTDEAGSALSSVPASGSRRGLPALGLLKYFYGPMDCGKSTLALQVDHNHARQGRRGLLLTRLDRSHRGQITSRMGLTRPAVDVDDDLDLRELVKASWAAGRRVDYLIVDEAQFFSPAQIEQLAQLADDAQIDVYAFGIATDFRSTLFPGSQRLFELADEVVPLQVEVLCWCGRPGRFNARVVDGRIAREGAQVVVADTAADEAEVRYQVLCRVHHRNGDLGPDGAPELPLG